MRETCYHCLHADFKSEEGGVMRGYARCKKAKTAEATNATKANLNRQQPKRWKNGARNLKNGAKDKGNVK